jgi:hypothetical protein
LPRASCIRLLEAETGQEFDDIVCNLFDTSLENEDQLGYEAILHLLGDSTKTHQVICNGLFLSITANLHATLEAFRELDQPRTLWQMRFASTRKISTREFASRFDEGCVQEGAANIDFGLGRETFMMMEHRG